MISIRPRLALTLSAAALATLAFAPGLVNAEPVAPADPGVRCAAKVGPGQYEFYLPGQKATDVNGVTWVCGPDGQWFRDYSGTRVTSGQISFTRYTNVASYSVATTRP